MLEIIKKLTQNMETSVVEGLKETTIKPLKESPLKESPLKNSIEFIENSSLESLKIQNELKIKEVNDTEKKGLTEEEKQRIKDEVGWSDEIINAISSMKEYEIYKNANLVEADINGRKVLIRNDIDWDQKDSMGRTNRERAEAGLSPINQDGDTIELHHIGQKNDGPLAELTPDEHRSKGNYGILHDSTSESEINRDKFNNERCEHWRERANNGGQNG